MNPIDKNTKLQYFEHMFPDQELKLQHNLQVGTDNLVNHTKDKEIAAYTKKDKEIHDDERAKRKGGNTGGKMRSQRKMRKKSSKRKTHKKKVQRRIKSKSQRRQR